MSKIEITLEQAAEIRAACAAGEDRAVVGARYGIDRKRTGTIARGDVLTKPPPDARALPVGSKYGQWEVKAEGPRHPAGGRTYVCACLCGRTTRTIRAYELTSGTAKMCKQCGRDKCHARMSLRLRIGVAT